MKKLSIEQKAKRYDEAIEIINDYYQKTRYSSLSCASNDIEVLEKAFPELKESEDEKIWKEIISALKYANHKGVYDKHLAWLEKQGEHTNFRNKIQIGDKVTRNEDGVLVNLSQLKRVAKKDEKQCEQKPATMSLDEAIEHCKEKSCGNSECALEHKQLEKWLTELKELKEQKPTWSEEDEMHIRELESLVKQVWAIAERENDKGQIHKMSNLSFFLKTLKPQLKQEWSEEDKAILEKCIGAVKVSCYSYSFKSEAENWLKSLRPQNTWKPSEGHLKALEDAMNKYHGSYSATLCQLYGELEKLKK